MIASAVHLLRCLDVKIRQFLYDDNTQMTELITLPLTHAHGVNMPTKLGLEKQYIAMYAY